MRRSVPLLALSIVLIGSMTRVTTGRSAGDPAAQDNALQSAVRSRVEALENLAAGSLDDAVSRFEREHLSPAYLARTSVETRRGLVEAIRAAAQEAGDVRLARRDGGYALVLQGPRTHEISFTLEAGEPYRIDTIAVSLAAPAAPAARLDLTPANLGETFDRLEREGLSGVVYVRLNGQVLLERPLGQANADLKVPVRLDTIFATGSRPIDYTAAAILLLDQRARLRLDDPIDRFMPGVPADKRGLTIRHLMTGQSGLPDFFHTADDWHRDLAFIDRATAERRILSLPLRFAPGSGAASSHAAYGLLAAIVERASGETYPAFLRRHLLDPAGMTRTGFNGDTRGFALTDFAVGRGPSSVGLPNIPPNWGPTSWLIMGSGGMYSTLPDLVRFYAFLRSGDVLDAEHARRFLQASVSRDGSDRGFELFHAYNPAGHEAMLLMNSSGPGRAVQPVFEALERLVSGGRTPPA